MQVFVRFSEAIDPTSVTPATFWVSSDTGMTAGKVTLGLDSILFSPNERWSLAATYQVFVGTGIVSATGEKHLGPGSMWAFKVRDGQWSQPITLPMAYSSDRVIALYGGAGNAVGASAVISESGGSQSGYSNFTLLYRSFDLNEVWQPTVCHLCDDFTIGPHDGYVSASGHGVFGFEVNGGGEIWTIRLSPGSGDWSVPVRIDQGMVGAKPHSRTGAQGDSHCVWVSADGSRVLASRAAPDTIWAPPAQLNSSAPGAAAKADVFFNDAGIGLAVWSQQDNAESRRSLWTRLYTPGSGWAANPSEIVDNALVESPTVLLGTGHAVVLWEEAETSSSAAYLIKSRFLTLQGMQWSASMRVDEASLCSSCSRSPRFVAGSPYAFALWTSKESFIPARDTVVVRRLDLEAGAWMEALELDGPSIIHAASNESLAIDSHGNALAVWEQSQTVNGPGREVGARRYLVGEGWQAPQVLLPSVTLGLRQPFVAFRSDGRAVAVANTTSDYPWHFVYLLFE